MTTNNDPGFGRCLGFWAEPLPPDRRRSSVMDLGVWEWWCSLFRPADHTDSQDDDGDWGRGCCDRVVDEQGDAG